MGGNCAQAAKVATGCAKNQNSAEYKQLSSMMCWDAVVHCAQLADIIDQTKYKSILSRAKSMITTAHTRIEGAIKMRAVPEGHIIGFFEEKDGAWNIIHAMMSVGNGVAAGNKNECIGIGHSIGWETLDLAGGLKWRQDGDCDVPGKHPKTGELVHRRVRAYHRPATDLKAL